MRRAITKEQTAQAERNRKIFNRALLVIGWYSKKSREEIIAMLDDDGNSAWAADESQKSN